jgi:tetratricopeptide (TPR) repeat protein
MIQKLKEWLGKRPEILWGLLIFALALVQYANTLGHEYVWDDDIVIVYNKRVQQGFAAIPGHFEFRTRENFEDFTGYRPVTMSSFSIDIGLFGMNPRAGHVTNVILFALLCVVLFRTLRQLFPNFHPAFSFFVTLLFLVHPIHVEVVANIKSRDEILALLFGLLSLQYFVRHYRSGNWLSLGSSAVCLVLAALSKEGALTFFAVIPLTVIFLLEGSRREKLIGLAKFPVILLVLAGVFLLLTGKLPGSSTPVTTTAYIESNNLGNCMAVNLPSKAQHVSNSVFLFAENVRKFFFPSDLVYFSGFDVYPVKSWSKDFLVLGISVMLLIALFVGTYFFWRRRRPLLFGAWFFFWTVVIYLQLPFLLLADTIADRFLFTPSVGLCIATVYGFFVLLRIDPASNPLLALQKQTANIAATLKNRAKGLSFGLMAICLLLSGLTFSRNLVWKDNMTLFSNDLPKLDNCARAHYYYASEMVKTLDTSKNPQETKQEIIQHYQRAIEITPQSYYAYVRLADLYQRWGDFKAQAVLCDSALRHYPGQADIWHSKGMAEYYQGNYPAAAKALNEARLRAPELEDNWEFLARAQERAGEFDAALATLEEAMARNATYLFYYDVLSDTYFDSGDTAQSFLPILTLLELDGQNPVWWRKLIGRYQIIGDNAAADHYYQLSQSKGIVLQ